MSESRSVMSYSYSPDPMDYSPLRSSAHGDAPGKNPGVGCHALLQGIFSIEPGSPVLQVDSLPSEPPDLKTTKRIDDSTVNVSDM